MSDEGPDSLVLRYLRGIDRKLDRLVEDMHDVKLRLGSVEEEVAGLRRDFVRMQHTLDRHGERLDRIERRLDLLPA